MLRGKGIPAPENVEFINKEFNRAWDGQNLFYLLSLNHMMA